MTPTVGRFTAWLLCSRKYLNRRIAVHLDTAGTASCSRPFANASGDVPAITSGSKGSGLANNVQSARPATKLALSSPDRPRAARARPAAGAPLRPGTQAVTSSPGGRSLAGGRAVDGEQGPGLNSPQVR